MKRQATDKEKVFTKYISAKGDSLPLSLFSSFPLLVCMGCG